MLHNFISWCETVNKVSESNISHLIQSEHSRSVGSKTSVNESVASAGQIITFKNRTHTHGANGESVHGYIHVCVCVCVCVCTKLTRLGSLVIVTPLLSSLLHLPLHAPPFPLEEEAVVRPPDFRLSVNFDLTALRLLGYKTGR